MSKWKRLLHIDVNFVKTFIVTCTPKKWDYGYKMVVYVHHVQCIYNKSIYIYII